MYGNDFAGRKTASGEPFDPAALIQAAMMTSVRAPAHARSISANQPGRAIRAGDRMGAARR